MNVRGLLCAVSAAAVLGLPALAGGAPTNPPPGGQPRVDTVTTHEAEDNVVHDGAIEQRLQAHTRQATAAYAQAAAAAVSGTPDQVGRWGPVVDWPVVAVHVALLSDGLVLAYDSVGDHATETYPAQTFSRATLFNPVTGAQTAAWFDGYNIFCSGLAHLADGRIFVAGGNKDQNLNGIVHTTLFDPASSSWSHGPDMAAPRWYPSVTPLRNGEMLITSGGASIPEVRRTNGTLRALSSASLSQPLYPWFDLAPNGRAFYSGPDQTMRRLDTSGTGSWQTLTQRVPASRRSWTFW